MGWMALDLGKSEGVMGDDGFIGVLDGLFTPFDCEVVGFDIFQVVKFVEGVGSQPRFDPPVDVVWSQSIGFDFGFFFSASLHCSST
jgi:hypothetical protein